MSDVNELRRQRRELETQLAALTGRKEYAFRVNSDALALQRAGVTQKTDAEMTQFSDNEVAGDTAMTDLRRRIEAIDVELETAAKRPGFLRRLRK